MLSYKHVILSKQKNNNHVVDTHDVSLNHQLEDFVLPKRPPKGAGDKKNGAAAEQGADQVLAPPADQGADQVLAPPADQGADEAPDQVLAPPADQGAETGAADQVPAPAAADQGSDTAPDEEDTDKEVPVSPPPAKKIWKDVPAKNQFAFLTQKKKDTTLGIDNVKIQTKRICLCYVPDGRISNVKE
jgi:hypothetical protein